jgi:hypothetical protein
MLWRIDRQYTMHVLELLDDVEANFSAEARETQSDDDDGEGEEDDFAPMNTTETRFTMMLYLLPGRHRGTELPIPPLLWFLFPDTAGLGTSFVMCWPRAGSSSSGKRGDLTL